ncbi:MAG: hypothetical protein M1821_001088 [Bathelium mastoideum]|nr:MAG: hypothetical protein M1821_001088 [Bathelium mastoideum]KAI9693885.1 MAG: hypothetical protein M1822_003156 [Bathelium mastoideum]
MGLFTPDTPSRHSSHHSSHHHRSSSTQSRPVFVRAPSSHHSHHSAHHSPSIFGGSTTHHHNSHSRSFSPTPSSSSFFFRPSSRSAYSSRRRPRDGYIQYLLARLRQLFRQLWSFVRRHPMRVLLLVLPLVTGGALAGAMRGLGVRLPRGLEGLMGGRRMSGLGGGYYGSRGYGSSSGGSWFGGGSGGLGGVGGLLKMAQMFA